MSCPALKLTESQITLALSVIDWLEYREDHEPPAHPTLPGYDWWAATDLAGDEDAGWAEALKAAVRKYNGMNTYWVTVRYVVEGQLKVQAASEEEAKENVLDEMTFPGTCELTDWKIKEVREIDAVDAHGRPVKA